MGLLASANLDAWSEGRVQGLEAYWVDATKVGVPSDYYHLTARGPALSRLPERDCRTHRSVLVSHTPGWDSPGDYAATASGVCRVGTGRSRWTAFVLAPGFGPARAVGIPQSGLYFVLAMVRERPGAGRRLERLVSGVSFGGTPVGDLFRAAGATGPQV